MKKSVNGKSFDEIFDERGVKVYRPKIGRFYFIESAGGYCYLFPHKYTKRGVIYSECAVADDGNFHMVESQTVCLIDKGDVESYYEATTDQIALLNLYKSES